MPSLKFITTMQLIYARPRFTPNLDTNEIKNDGEEALLQEFFSAPPGPLEPLAKAFSVKLETCVEEDSPS